MKVNSTKTTIGLDVGAVRIGVALAHNDVKIAQPLTTLQNGPDIFEQLETLASEHEAGLFVVGWPRGASGQSTQQTAIIEQFADQLRTEVTQDVILQDEAHTSQKAEAELEARGKPFAKGDVDALAATYILNDYLETLYV